MGTSVASAQRSVTPIGPTDPSDPTDVPCFLEGTRLLTANGYKAVESLTEEDKLITLDNRAISFGILRTEIFKTTLKTAPFRIEKDALGVGMPAAPLFLSLLHKFRVRDNVWITPDIGVKKGLDIQQCPIDQSITYYHVYTDNFARDMIIAEGLVTEPFGKTKEVKATYTWNENKEVWMRNEFKESSLLKA